MGDNGLWYTTLVTAAFGCSASLVVLILHFVFQKLNLHFAKWVGFMALATFISTLNTLIYLMYEPGDNDFRLACKFHGFVVQFSTTGIYLWNFVIAFFIWYYHKELIAPAHPDPRKIALLMKYIPTIQIIVWILCVLLSTIPFAFNAYGHSDIWCWFKPSTPWVMWVFFYAPLWACFLGIIVFFFHILYINYMDSTQYNPTDEESLTGMEKYQVIVHRTGLLYIIAYILSWTLPSIHRIVIASTGSGPHWLEYSHVVSENIIGVYVCAIYLYSVYFWEVNIERE